MRPLLTLLLLACPAFAADPPKPAAPIKLVAGRLFVIDSATPVVVLASPPGVVTIEELPGPLPIYARFADGPAAEVLRKFEGKSVYVIRAVPADLKAAAATDCELIVIPVGLKGGGEITRRQISVAGGVKPQPPPKPKPTPKPPAPKPVPPAPTPEPSADKLPAGSKLYVKVVAETLTWTAATADSVGDTAMRAALKQLTGNDLEIVRPGSAEAAAMNLAPFVVKAGGVPCLIVMDAGGTKPGFVRLTVPLPKSAAGILEAARSLYAK